MEKELDKVYEVYMNDTESEFAVKTRERIQWICKNVSGENVLDVGCSQGITSILLGRENKTVLALDIEEEAIDFAKLKLEEEEKYVQENVTFVAGDFVSYDFAGERFDTIIMTEVLEHISDVQDFIDKIAECVKESAQVIITVPFGINDHWDHKRTYYFGMLYEQLENYKIIDVQFMGKWLGVVAKFGCADDSIKGISPDKELMLEEEEAFFKIERKLVDDKVRYKKYISEQKEKINNLVQKKEELQERNKKATKELNELSKRYAELTGSFLGKLALGVWFINARIKNILYSVYCKIKSFLPGGRFQKSEESASTNAKVAKKADKREKLLLPDFMQEAVIMNDEYKFDWKEKFLELRENICDVDFLQKINNKIARIPESNGSRYYGKMPLKIGMIADEFLYRSYADMADFVYITPEDYKYDIDILFVATAWKGLNNEWKGLGSINNDETRKKLYVIINYYKKLGKKVIFYSKEDPSNYYVFLDIAKQCDFIFTTAEECVEHYKKDTGIENVTVLDFSINPIQFNPIGIQLFNFDEVLFAGTWWNKKYPERKKDMEIIFESVLNAGKGLRIIDRNYSLKNPDYFYPARYLKFVAPEVSHAVLQKIHKMYSWSININSIKNSNTMFASRVYELQALGNLIISNNNKGMERKFPNIIIEDGSGNAMKALTQYSDEEIYSKRIDGVRRVLSGETTYDRINFILKFIGEKTVNYDKSVAIIIPEENEAELWNMAQEQTYGNKELIRSSALNNEVFSQYDMIAFFTEDSEYSQFYIEDMVNAFKYTDCDFITKKAYFEKDTLVGGIEHNYVKEYDEIGRTVFWRSSYSLEEILDGKGGQDKKGYSIDHFNYRKR